MLLNKKVRNKQTYTNFNLSPHNNETYLIGSEKTQGLLQAPKNISIQKVFQMLVGKESLLTSGKIELRGYTSDNKLSKKLITYSPNSKQGSKKNQILIDGDIIHAINGLIKSSFYLINQIKRPIANFFTSMNES